MVGGILTVAGSLLAIVLWWLNNTPARRQARLLKAIAKLRSDYAEAIARGDGVAAAECQRRLRELETASHPHG